MKDLKKRLGNILVAFTYDKKPIYAKDLKVNKIIINVINFTLNSKI